MLRNFAPQPLAACLVHVAFGQRVGVNEPDHYRSPLSLMIVSEIDSPAQVIGSHSSSES